MKALLTGWFAGTITGAALATLAGVLGLGTWAIWSSFAAAAALSAIVFAHLDARRASTRTSRTDVLGRP